MTTPLEWTHQTSAVTERGVQEMRHATQDELTELARTLDILSCDSLAVSYEIKPLSGGRFRFSGELEARVTQACVVTLEPVPEKLSERFEIELVPAPEAEPEDHRGAADGDLEILSAPDFEVIEDGRIEAGVIIFQLVSAALEPYPRKKGAEFDWVDPKIAADPTVVSPFAALAKLKPKT
ncbi:MAG: DUF177 domain-containing protein [Hyphomicrobium sp.]